MLQLVGKRGKKPSKKSQKSYLRFASTKKKVRGNGNALNNEIIVKTDRAINFDCD